MVIKWLMIVLGVLLTAGTAVFVAGEFALVALDPSVVDARAQAGDKRAGRVAKAVHPAFRRTGGYYADHHFAWLHHAGRP